MEPKRFEKGTALPSLGSLPHDLRLVPQNVLTCEYAILKLAEFNEGKLRHDRHGAFALLNHLLTADSHTPGCPGESAAEIEQIQELLFGLENRHTDAPSF